MTQHKLTITIASLLLLLFSSLVSAQEPTANTKTAEAARRQKAVELLESLATQVAALQSPENRARIGANTTMSEDAGSFASCDFDRAVSLGGQFERNEIRIMAQVKLAQSIFAGPQKRNPALFKQFHVDYR